MLERVRRYIVYIDNYRNSVKFHLYYFIVPKFFKQKGYHIISINTYISTPYINIYTYEHLFIKKKTRGLRSNFEIYSVDYLTILNVSVFLTLNLHQDVWTWIFFESDFIFVKWNKKWEWLKPSIPLAVFCFNNSVM